MGKNNKKYDYFVHMTMYKKGDKEGQQELPGLELKHNNFVTNPFGDEKIAKKFADALSLGYQNQQFLTKSDLKDLDRIEVTVDKFSWDGDYVGCCQKDVLKFR